MTIVRDYSCSHNSKNYALLNPIKPRGLVAVQDKGEGDWGGGGGAQSDK